MDKKVLPPELCKRIYEDYVKKPWISLEHILDFELYEVVLHNILPCNFYHLLNGNRKIRHWLNDMATFENFKSLVSEVIEKGECNINIYAINIHDWRKFVVGNIKVYDIIRHWRTGGELTFTHPWSFLNRPENQQDKWHLLLGI